MRELHKRDWSCSDSLKHCVKLTDGLFLLSETQAKRVEILTEMADVDEKLLVFALNGKPESAKDVSEAPKEIVERGRSLYSIACENPNATCVEMVESIKEAPGEPLPSLSQLTPETTDLTGEQSLSEETPATEKKKNVNDDVSQNDDGNEIEKSVHHRKKGPMVLIIVLSILSAALVLGSVYVLLQGSIDFRGLWNQITSPAAPSSSSTIISDSSEDESSSAPASTPKTEITLIIDAQPGTADASVDIPVASDSMDSSEENIDNEEARALFEGFNPNDVVDENSVQQ